MAKQHPIYASERTAAALLDMKLRDFRDLVDSGYLPAPIIIGRELKRWEVRQLQLIISGSAATGEELVW